MGALWGAMIWAYIFEESGGEEILIYAISEKTARRRYKRYFNKEAGKLLRRENW